MIQSSLYERNAIALRPLRPKQSAALAAVRQAIREGHKRIILQAPTGMGKTLMAAHMIASAIEKSNRPLFTCPAITLVDQTMRAFEAEGIRDIGIIQAQHERTDWNAAVQIASVQTLIRRPLPKVHFFVIDECFPAGTMISTLVGQIPIEKMKPRYSVFHALGHGTVRSVFKKKVSRLVKVRLNNGDHFKCTPDHPVFTASGWKKAGELEVRTVLFDYKAVRALWSGVWAEVLQDWRTCGISGVREAVSGAALLRELLREADREPDVERRGARCGVAIASLDKTQAADTGRKRQADARGAKIGAGDSGRGMAAGACGEDASVSALLSTPLQVGPGAPRTEDMPGTGRREPSLTVEAGAGCEERRSFAPVWVESVETEELGSPQFVYNLRVSGHPSYFANGVLVHNCHENFEGLNARLDSDEWKDKIAIGLTATPWARGMGLRWTRLVIAATIQELIDDGHLSPFAIYVPDHNLDRAKIKVVKGEFQDKSASEAMRNAVIIGDVVKTWKERGPGGKTFMFCVNRAHAKEQMQAFTDSGVPFGYIDATIEMDDRRRVFAQMKHGEIAGIASVGCLIRGVDEDVRCIIDAQPTKSEMRHVQKWGRGLRTADGKELLIGLDHAGNTLALGMVTDIHHETLDTRKPGDKANPTADKPVPKPKMCEKCHALLPPGKAVCPRCGERMKALSGVERREGEMVLFSAGKGPKPAKHTKDDKQEFYSGLLALAKERGHKDGWAFHAFRERFGAEPSGLKKIPANPSRSVRNFDHERRREYLESKKEAVNGAALH